MRGYQKTPARVPRHREGQVRLPDDETQELPGLPVKSLDVIRPEGEIIRVKAIGQHRGDIEVAIGPPDEPERTPDRRIGIGIREGVNVIASGRIEALDAVRPAGADRRIEGGRIHRVQEFVRTDRPVVGRLDERAREGALQGSGG